jgi:hypothetical protein
MKAKLLLICMAVYGGVCFSQTITTPNGFQNALWGTSPESVRGAAGIGAWQKESGDIGFPAELGVTVYSARVPVAGYPATTRYYFFDDKFFQATVTFDFNDLKNFDFNYNVFISVDRYYRAIHDKTLVFVRDIYDLLRKKYGKKEPVFKGLDPRFTFKATDAYLRQEQWNLRYHPYEFYKRIVCASYARWDFPATRAIFSISISAVDSRFDYLLSLSSIDLEEAVNRKKDLLRMQGL